MALAVKRRDLDPLVENRPLACRQKVTEPALVRRAQCWRDDQIAQPLANRFLGLPAEAIDALPVPAENQPVCIHYAYRVERRLEDRAQSAMQLFPTRFHFPVVASLAGKSIP